jgi:hypothetical protein
MPGYSSPTSLGLVAVGILAFYVVLQWGIRLLDLAFLEAIEHHAVPAWVGSVERALLSLSSLPRLVGGVIFLVWVHRAASNLRALGRTGMTMSPGWCVGSFFVPIASLFVPYKGVAEIATCSDPRESGVAPASVLGWWLLFIGSNVVWLVRLMAMRDAELGARIMLDVVATVMSTGAVALLFVVVRFVNAGQEEWARRRVG